VRAVEEALKGQALTLEGVERAAQKAVEGAIAQGANRYKIDLAPRVVARAILKVGGLA
jgi:xanthine dehydrogenase YagS FAD-binding subunit